MLPGSLAEVMMTSRGPALEGQPCAAGSTARRLGFRTYADECCVNCNCCQL